MTRNRPTPLIGGGRRAAVGQRQVHYPPFDLSCATGNCHRGDGAVSVEEGWRVFPSKV